MRRKEMMGIGYVTLSSRKRPIALEPLENGIHGITLRHIEDMRSPAQYFIDFRSCNCRLKCWTLRSTSSAAKARDFNPEFLTDHYRAAVVQLLKEKRAALPMPEATPVASHENVVNLMEALKRSLAPEGARTPKAASKAKNPKKAAAGQREMLLPIAGKGTGREKAKNRARPATRQRKAGKS